jgi:oligoribonuclease NrnB/cAMP/cGMP phosphodiesterase (DHH superfamily)
LRILHHNDPDGYASAHIVFDYALRTNLVKSYTDIHFHSMAYGMPLPPEIDYAHDSLVMVDFSLQPIAVMEEFLAKVPRGQLVWIDHHKTSVELEEVLPELLKPIPGVRQVNDAEGVPIAACELTWKFFHPGEEIPVGIKLLGSWDTWRWNTEENEQPKYFIQYCHSINCTPYTAEGREFWSKILIADNDPYGWLFDTVLAEGIAIDRFQKNEHKKRIRGKGFAGKFGGHSAIIVNDASSSLLFEDFSVSPDDVDLMVSFHYTRHGYWSVSLYSKQENVDCGAIAKKLGETGPQPSGGGHKGAAGFQCDWPYIEFLIERTQ